MLLSKLNRQVSIYFQFMRFHKPVGILLLWWPTAWALWLANAGSPPVRLILLFFLGTVIMRAAGCIINDIADRHIDSHVSRTKSRSLAQGQVSLIEAFLLFFLLVSFAFAILLHLPSICFYYALAAIFITILYPFCKRFIQGPQLVLGVAFSMGIPMAFAASNQLDYQSMILLSLINFLWIVSYDTEYAMVDREEDLQIGVQSTAILFGKNDRLIIGILQFVLHLLWLLFIKEISAPLLIFGSCWFLGGSLFIYQQRLLAQQQTSKYLQAFTLNGWYGFIMWLPFLCFNQIS